MEMVEILEIDSTPFGALCHLTWQVYLIDESTLKAMDILEGVHRGRYRRCARCAVDVNEESAGISGQKGRPSTCSSRQRRATSGAKCPKFQSKQDFLSGNLIVAWHLRSRLSMLFSCLFVCFLGTWSVPHISSLQRLVSCL